MADTVTFSTGKYYKLLNDIHASSAAQWNDAAASENLKEGFRPIGKSGAPFKGRLRWQRQADH
jgi:hypothetical protein